MDLLGTEIEPDFRIYEGNQQAGPTVADRTSTNATLLTPKTNELQRASSSRPDPDKRFHYRWVAASLAWEAAKLMPDNSDETARVLCEAGSWIKLLDPKSADVFYKALVRRCRKTAIEDQKPTACVGFPILDEQGHLREGKSVAVQTSNYPRSARL